MRVAWRELENDSAVSDQVVLLAQHGPGWPSLSFRIRVIKWRQTNLIKTALYTRKLRVATLFYSAQRSSA